MGEVTNNMTRLCGEILSMRRGRGNLNTALAHGAADRKNTVSQICGGFARSRAEMARQTKAVRHAFLENLKQRVHQHRRETRNDLMGARRAWMGKAR